MVRLLDVNLLIALAWPSHVHHGHAHAWLATVESSGWATCPLTQCGFVRISSNPSIIDGATTPANALSMLDRITGRPAHVFWPDDVPLAASPTVPTQLLVGHRQVTDAYLLGLAIHHGGALATFDRGTAHLLPQDSPHRAAVEVVPVG